MPLLRSCQYFQNSPCLNNTTKKKKKKKKKERKKRKKKKRKTLKEKEFYCFENILVFSLMSLKLYKNTV